MTREEQIQKLREEIANLLDKGDTDFNKEGGYTPERDLAYEKADQILALILKHIEEKLTVIDTRHITSNPSDWDKTVAEYQLNHTLIQIKEILK